MVLSSKGRTVVPDSVGLAPDMCYLSAAALITCRDAKFGPHTEEIWREGLVLFLTYARYCRIYRVHGCIVARYLRQSRQVSQSLKRELVQ